MTGVWHDWGQITQFLDHARRYLPPDDVEDRELLMASVLIHSYALVETAACESLGLAWRDLGAIEKWGRKVLAVQGKEWSAVRGGVAGVVEVAIVRNALAHGQRSFDAESADRLTRAGGDPRSIKQPIKLDYPDLNLYRGRLHSLLHHGGLIPAA